MQKSYKVSLGRIERFIFKSIFTGILNKRIRRTRHFQEWLRMPMNYVRQTEIPITHYLLDVKQGDRILDISSPKLLSYFLMKNGSNIEITDFDDYFISDFEKLGRANSNFSLKVFDVKSMPYEEGQFDKVFSISVLEHIPEDGDVKALKEICRVTKPGGTCIITLPFHFEYMEEWQKSKKFYWDTASNEEGNSFYQRRYSADRINETMDAVQGFHLEEIIYLAETPIHPPRVDSNGSLEHNFHHVEKALSQSIFQKWPFKRLPFLPYLKSRFYAKKYRYQTNDVTDKNIRQVVMKLIKK